MDHTAVAREINKVVVSQAREFVWGTNASQLSFVRKYMAMAPEHVLVTVQQEQEALTAIRGEHNARLAAHLHQSPAHEVLAINCSSLPRARRAASLAGAWIRTTGHCQFDVRY
jgi:hypothetical protein